MPWFKRRPSEYVREHFRFTTAPAHLPGESVSLDQLLEMMHGTGLLVYASDYPHEHGDGLPALLDRLTDEQRRGVLWGTAAEVYGLLGRLDAASRPGVQRRGRRFVPTCVTRHAVRPE